MNTHQQIDSVFRSLDREIWIVTSQTDTARGGLVATWVSQTSIDPLDPVVVIGIAVNHNTRSLIDKSGRFGLHLLSAHQTDLALNFAIGSGQERDKLTDIPLQPNHSIPILQDCVSWLECVVQHKNDGGDRIYYWGQVINGRQISAEQPLREKQLIAAASPQQLAALKQTRLEDVEIQRPLLKEWRQS
jgi:flavin reductase (DIM6/NTAB) family NADH-FMN oxidoreductase RutF